MKQFLDLVIAGPDMSGTSTQIDDLINYFLSSGQRVRDLRGSEMATLFHSMKFQEYSKDHISFGQRRADPNNSGKDIMPFLLDEQVSKDVKYDFLWKAQTYVERCRFASMQQDFDKNPTYVATSDIFELRKNDRFPYINPLSADVWVLEEPTFRGAGSENRFMEQNRSYFGLEIDPVAAAHDHQSYRISEFFRFRKHMREHGLIILRSRSEESGCYQVYDPQYWTNGILTKDYLDLSGHKIAFANPPTHIFVVCATPNWSVRDYLALKTERSGGRPLDDHEKNAQYQVMVNKRYATNWLEEFYDKGCSLHGGTPPQIFRFDIYDSKKDVREKMISTLKTLQSTQ